MKFDRLGDGTSADGTGWRIEVASLRAPKGHAPRNDAGRGIRCWRGLCFLLESRGKKASVIKDRRRSDEDESFYPVGA